jgi:lysophospholipase L1-like esterase
MHRFTHTLFLGASVCIATLAPAYQATTVRFDPAAWQRQVEQDQLLLRDWPNLARYRNEDARIPSPAIGEVRVVFLGDSITDFWGRKYGKFFSGKPYFNRGISGQTTPQMLIRLQQDVIALKPTVVVILAGTNDLAGNTGPESLEDIEANLASIVQLANTNGIRTVLSSILPVCDYIHPRTAGRPPQKIIELNSWMKSYCARSSCVYLDYYTSMVDGQGMLAKDLTNDCLHPNDAGYAVMQPIAEQAIREALAAKRAPTQ